MGMAVVPANHGGTMTNRITRSYTERRFLDDMPSQLAALETMSVAALAEKYRELYGEPTRSRNRAYLKKRLAWRIQASFEGGLSHSALERIKQLGDQLPERWQVRLVQPAKPADATSDDAAAATVQMVLAATEPRDPRVPSPGTVLRREFGGRTHEVSVCVEGFSYDGRSYKSLSAIATEITGTRWNGFLFFGLQKRGKAARGDSAP